MQSKEIAEKLMGLAQRADELKLKPESTENEIGSVDKINAEELKLIVKEIGWPTINKVGQKASESAWLIALHSDHDIEFQKDCLSLLKENKKYVQLKHIAYLEDRILVAEGHSQIYGTQVKDLGDRLVLQNVIGMTSLNKKRKSMRLNTIEEYKKELEEAYKLPVIID